MFDHWGSISFVSNWSGVSFDHWGCSDFDNFGCFLAVNDGIESYMGK